jgi:pyrroline-5-carboxylate reductase
LITEQAETMSKIGFIGGGNMARALIGGLLADGKSAADILVSEPVAEASQRLQSEFGVQVNSDNDEVARQVDCLVLAVKPQVIKGVVTSIADTVRASRPLLVSIVAGIPVASLENWLTDTAALVRTMPNTPALVGKGITALFANGSVTESQHRLAEQIMDAVGETLWVEDESLLDAVTAVSGSGPAYFFRVMEAMVEAGQSLGLTAEQSTQLTLATAAGAAELAIRSEYPVAQLRRQVTSPGGTTAAALEVMQALDVGDLFDQALRAAHRRAGELAQELGN